ncbi:LysR family transcriptional regulator [Subtercola endophyticus]|uniref:LysR family transcriptional regulator n=1 Tax=Subtercola endophyticus TaxID=2895559 RepID=UPI001E34551D|nr:LysR family transcriptional regulator [Subtercola endophyticus]UFS58290.1 LysR family transcriptional regulator [Subtercola endophyticus]
MADSLDIVQLRTFVAIADCGGFGRAASALHLSQPTVSQHVRLLERKLGQTLVEKAGRQAAFTAAGDRLLVQARRILTVHDDALLSLDVSHERTIVIGSTETAADQILPQLLETMRDAFPDRKVQFLIDRSTQMEDAVARGAIDLAIVLGLSPDAPGSPVGTLPLDWYSAPGWSPPTDSDEWPLVAYVAPCGMRQRALEVLTAHGRTVTVVAESTSLEGVIAAARAGLGVAAMPNAGHPPDGLIVRRDLPSLGMMTLRLATRRGLDVEIEQVALVALEEFFATHTVAPPPLVSIHPSSF